MKIKTEKTKTANFTFTYSIQEVEHNKGTAYSCYIPSIDAYFTAPSIPESEEIAEKLVSSFIHHWRAENKKNQSKKPNKPGVEKTIMEIEYSVIKEEEFYDCFIPVIDTHFPAKTEADARRQVPNILKAWIRTWKEQKQKMLKGKAKK
jgi:hypothetical protein